MLTWVEHALANKKYLWEYKTSPKWRNKNDDSIQADIKDRLEDYL